MGKHRSHLESQASHDRVDGKSDLSSTGKGSPLWEAISWTQNGERISSAQLFGGDTGLGEWPTLSLERQGGEQSTT